CGADLYDRHRTEALERDRGLSGDRSPCDRIRSCTPLRRFRKMVPLTKTAVIWRGKMNQKKLRTAAEYFIYFMMYSVLGWLYEVFLEVVVYRWGFSNRGVLFGPYCVIYGFGALLLIFSLKGLKRKKFYLGKIPVTPFLVFGGIVLITTVVELAASYLMEWLYGSWM